MWNWWPAELKLRFHELQCRDLERMHGRTWSALTEMAVKVKEAAMKLQEAAMIVTEETMKMNESA